MENRVEVKPMPTPPIPRYTAKRALDCQEMESIALTGTIRALTNNNRNTIIYLTAHGRDARHAAETRAERHHAGKPYKRPECQFQTKKPLHNLWFIG